MDQILQAAGTLLATTLSALAVYAVQAVRAYITNLIQQRLGDGASRVAGEIAAVIQGNPDVQDKARILIAQGADLLVKRFPSTAPKVGHETLQGMIRGELGKLGVALPSIKAATP